MQGYVRVSKRLSGILFVGLITILLMSCGGQQATQPTTLPPAPKAGSLMAWVDGSTLMFVNDPNGQETNGRKGFWATVNAISNYQFALCVQAGKCKPPTIPGSANDYGDPSKENLPVSIVGPDIVGPDHSAGYCHWIMGRELTDSESTLLKNQFAAGVGGSPLGLTPGVRCIVDSPRPSPAYTKTSAYYGSSKSMEMMDSAVTFQSSFCQNGRGYFVFDLTLGSADTLQSVLMGGKGTCQTVNGNRVVCYGASNTGLNAVALIQRNGFSGLNCPAGYQIGQRGCAISPSTSVSDKSAFPGLGAGWTMDSIGAPIPVHGQQLPNGGWSGPVTHDFKIVNGVLVGLNPQSNNNPGNLVLVAQSWPAGGVFRNISSSSNPTLARQLILVSSECPTGYYEVDTSSGPECVSDGPSGPFCLGGYSYDSATHTCGTTSYCTGDTYFNPGTSSCAPVCPAGTHVDFYTRTCVCGASGFGDSYRSSCSCPPGSTFDSTSGTCVNSCSPPSYYDGILNLCRYPSCPSGQYFDGTSLTCMYTCPFGTYYDSTSGTCSISCPSNYQPDSTSRTCEDACRWPAYRINSGECICGDRHLYDLTTQTCNQSQCETGYQLDPATHECHLIIPAAGIITPTVTPTATAPTSGSVVTDGNYPGCPPGQLFIPFRGTCDWTTTALTASSVLHIQSIKVQFPDCSASDPGDGNPGGEAPPPSCPAGETYTCDPVCGCAPN